MSDEPATRTLAPLTVVAFAVGVVALVLLFTLNRFDTGVVLAAGVAAVILGIVAGAASAREQRGGVWFARLGSLIGVVVVIAALFRLS